ncbi:MAG: carbonic anhydrase [Armatimonadota bacterium]
MDRPTPRGVLLELLEGNARYVAGEPVTRAYPAELRATLAAEQSPIAAVVACSDTRVAPEVIFDQPLGKLFVARIPGNVAAESVQWTVDLAVGHFKVPLVVVLGHSGCLAVSAVLNKGYSCSWVSTHIGPALNQARRRIGTPTIEQLVEENARFSAHRLVSLSSALRSAVRAGECECVPAVLNMISGEVAVLDGH